MSYTLIQTVTLTSNQASISFNSIPATFDDLVVVHDLRTNTGGEEGTGIRFNGSTSGYSMRTLSGDGSAVGSETAPYGVTNFGFAGFVWSSAGNTSVSIYIPNYISSVAKSYSVDAVTEINQTRSIQALVAGLHTGTSAISSLSITAYNSKTFVTGGMASLYGVKRGSSGGVVVS